MAYQALELNGSGYASITDGNQAGLYMGYSDFMLEAYILTTSSAKQPIVYKSGTGGYFDWHINVTTGFLQCIINDGTNTATITGDVKVTDGRFHVVRVTLDKSSATGGRLYVDGTEDTSARTDVTSVLNIDNDGIFYVGYDGTDNFIGRLDEIRPWNFGYGGLPADVATYDTWRATGRNIFLDISEYNSGGWNGYADADRTEFLTDPGIENWTGDTPDDWMEDSESAGVRDITDEQIEVHGGSHAAKLEATNNNGTAFMVKQSVTLEANEYYELSGWIYFASRTAGLAQLKFFNVTDGSFGQTSLSAENGAYIHYKAVGKPTVASSLIVCNFHGETTTGIVYYDDISVKRTGLVAHWKFNGDLLDETNNSNDLTAGGTGNVFPEYTLRHKGQKMLLGVI